MNLALLRRTLVIVAFAGVAPTVLAGCPKKPPPPVPDAAPPPPPEDAALTDLAPLPIEDAGPEDADADAAKKVVGVYVNPNVAAIRACCAQISTQAKSLGASPEAGMLLGLAAQCNAAAGSIQTNPNSPEVAIFKQAMAGRNLPGVCRSF